MKPEMIDYGGYELTIMHHPPMWQVGIYPKTAKRRMPPPHLQLVSLPQRDEAVAEAKRRVDSGFSD
jgi:hypothetical protein